MKIEIGAGEYPRLIEEGYMHADIRYPMPHQEICLDIRYLPLKDNSLDAIAIIFCLEHVSWRLEVMPILNEMYRVLTPGGNLFVIVPNLLYIAKMIVDYEDRIMEKYEQIMLNLGGLQDYEYNYHKAWFTPNMLTALMENVGFRDIFVTPHTINEDAFHLRGYK